LKIIYIDGCILQVVEKEIQERQISTDIVNTSKKTDKKKVVSLFKLSQTKKDNI